jgi:hypothetical protein
VLVERDGLGLCGAYSARQHGKQPVHDSVSIEDLLSGSHPRFTLWIGGLLNGRLSANSSQGVFHASGAGWVRKLERWKALEDSKPGHELLVIICEFR